MPITFKKKSTITIPHSKPTFGKEETMAIQKLLESGQLGINSQVELFEAEFARFIGVQYAVAVNSGSAALHMALKLLNAGPSVRVVIPSYSCAALMNAVLYTGATPLLADADRQTCNPCDLPEADIYVIPHMFGLPATLPKRGLVVEDCAGSVGAKLNGKMCGSLGDVSVFSFYDTKMISTGQGGMIATNNPKIAEKARDLVEYDKRKVYEIRYNYRMSALNATVGRVQLKKLPDFIRKRAKLAEIYYRKLDGLPIQLPIRKSNVFYRFAVKTGGADRFIKYLNKNGVDCKRPVFQPLHRYFDELDRSKFKGAEELYKKLVSLPIYPLLREEDAEKIADIIRNYY